MMMRNPYLMSPGQPVRKRRSIPQIDLSSIFGGVDEYDELEAEPPIIPPIRQAYLDKLMNAPSYEENKPSTGRHILAALLGGMTGLGGVKQGIGTAESIKNQRYNTARQRHSEELEPLAKAADVEAEGIKDDRLGMKEKYGRLKEKNRLMLDAMKLESQHAKRMADAERMDSELERKQARDEVDAWYKEEGIKLRDRAIDLDARKHSENLGFRRQQHDENIGFRREKEENLKGYRQQRIEKMGQRAEPYLPANEQKNIDRQAFREVANDPRFERFVDKDKMNESGVIEFGDVMEGDTIVEEMDEETMKLLEQEIAKAKARVALRKRSDYSIFEDDDDEDDDEDE